MTNQTKQDDADGQKGAVENDRPSKKDENSLAGQIVHRGPDKPADGEDSDFPEPGSSPEHSGQRK
jgi:hypothetical protein